MNKIKILFIIPYPLKEAPSQRFRFEQYFDVLDKNRFEYRTSSFINEETWKIIYSSKNYFKKFIGIVLGFFWRKLLLFRVPFYDYIFIHREASPIGPPYFEFIIAVLLRKKIIYDFDDAIWLSNTSENNKLIASLKCHWKVKYICKWAYKVSCGNKYLAAYAKQFNQNVIINPTTIDTDNLHNLTTDYNQIKPVVGWTGTHSTISYLDSIIPVLQNLEKDFDFTFIVISNKEPSFKLRSLKYIPWSKETEIEDLLKINIGIMPLTDDIWAQGKCGFKGLQYMSLGIATIMSPVGVNNQIVKDRVNGLLASSNQEWTLRLTELISNTDFRNQLGREGQQTIIENYSVKSNIRLFLNLFK